MEELNPEFEITEADNKLVTDLLLSVQAEKTLFFKRIAGFEWVNISNMLEYIEQDKYEAAEEFKDRIKELNVEPDFYLRKVLIKQVRRGLVDCLIDHSKVGTINNWKFLSKDRNSLNSKLNKLLNRNEISPYDERSVLDLMGYLQVMEADVLFEKIGSEYIRDLNYRFVKFENLYIFLRNLSTIPLSLVNKYTTPITINHLHEQVYLKTDSEINLYLRSILNTLIVKEMITFVDEDGLKFSVNDLEYAKKRYLSERIRAFSNDN